MIALALNSAGIGLLVIGLAAQLTHRVQEYAARGLLALGCGASTLAGALNGGSIWTYLNAALTAWHAYAWWTGGGGDNTRRRLRETARRFTPVRRTAPAA
ncbi:hypothetical protein [Streptomyces sp. NPDC088925]|uniref:hypothetical protein n=1 Tax=Streptomyces sp. NPDC088925 TaxID=3365914 RepID=UPI00380FC451